MKVILQAFDFVELHNEVKNVIIVKKTCNKH